MQCRRETANFEFPLMTKGGVGLDVLLNATTRRDDQGNIIGVVGIGELNRLRDFPTMALLTNLIFLITTGQDITGRFAQEREYTHLIDIANAPIFVSSSDELFVYNLWHTHVAFYCRESTH